MADNKTTQTTQKPAAAGTKSEKWAGAVANATGQAMEVTGEAGADLMKIMGGGDAASMIKKHADKKSVEAVVEEMTKSGAWEFAPQLFKLEENDEVSGLLEGNGPPAEFERVDKTTGEITTNIVQTWIIASLDGTKRISVLSSVQLDRKLPPFLGGPVKILRGKDINTGNGQRVTDYLVAGPKSKDGTRRSWATKPVIDVPPAAPQLGGGQVDIVDAPNGVPASA